MFHRYALELPRVSDVVHEKLRLIRSKEDLNLPPTPYLRDTIRNRDGTDGSPLSLRNYQKQMVVHLLAMKRFVVGDDCGLGKSLCSIAALTQIWVKSPDTKVMILTKKSSVFQWEGEFQRFTNGVQVFVADGTPDARKKAQAAWQATTAPSVLIQGYVSAGNDFANLQKLSQSC